MFGVDGLKRLSRCGRSLRYQRWPWSRRELHDGRNRLSNFWAPAQGRKTSDSSNTDDGHDLLLRAGFVRQAHSGIFHLLPLGLRVQDKIERLIDRHMRSIGASKVSLSSLSSQELWQQSGRLEGRDSEFFRLSDRKEAKFLLSPTHEEEITMIVKNAVQSYKDLPLRLYQVSRKYRDEARPRQGLLRGREFLMKDLYTFDATDQHARQTYEEVRSAYRAFLDELSVPYLVAAADSGNMGGSLSHEYHFTSPKGEDTIITCKSCEFVINEELNAGRKVEHGSLDAEASAQHWIGLSKDRKTLYQALFPAGDHELNTYAMKELCPELDLSIDLPTKEQKQRAVSHIVLVDPRISPQSLAHLPPSAKITPADRLLTKHRTGDACPVCDTGTLHLHQAVEIGHTFHLGTRYSTPLEAQIVNAKNERVDVSMGCHGIGVSRLIGAMASLLADSKGLNWPVRVAAYSTAVIFADNVNEADRQHVCDTMSSVLDFGQALSSDLLFDAIIDDRDRPLGWKLKDADLIGYPLIVVVGKAWAHGKLEVQCRQLGVKEEISLSDITRRLEEHLATLTTLRQSNQ